jgi:four helix bundle protein
MFGFEKLDVWQRSIDLADQVYQVSLLFPDYEKFGLANQIRRAAVSISSNIAEGSGRGSDRDFIRFLQIAYGSLMEVVSQLKIAQRRNFLTSDQVNSLYTSCEQIGRMLSGLRASLQRKLD